MSAGCHRDAIDVAQQEKRKERFLRQKTQPLPLLYPHVVRFCLARDRAVYVIAMKLDFFLQLSSAALHPLKSALPRSPQPPSLWRVLRMVSIIFGPSTTR